MCHKCSGTGEAVKHLQLVSNISPVMLVWVQMCHCMAALSLTAATLDTTVALKYKLSLKMNYFAATKTKYLKKKKERRGLRYHFTTRCHSFAQICSNSKVKRSKQSNNNT